tara:strand:+ start:514 stop:810 length:297 start_codon:yes stop_codon:yes gene_type:complete
MDSAESRDRKFLGNVERVFMYFLYSLFIGVFITIAWVGSIREALVMVPIAAVSVPIAKWSIKWQNERYIRSAKNVDDIESLSQKLNELEERLNDLDNK